LVIKLGCFDTGENALNKRDEVTNINDVERVHN